MSELSEFLGTSSSTKLTEISNEGEWINSFYFSDLMVRIRKMVRMEEGPRTSGTNRREISEAQGMASPAKLQVKSVKRGKRRRWDPVVTAAELARK